MEDVADGLQSAWKETLQGLKIGYKKAKTAFKIPSRNSSAAAKTGGMNDTDNSFSPNDRRRQFQAKYANTDNSRKGTSTTQTARRLSEESDSSSYCESSDAVEGLTDEEVKGLVECKFFDPAYDPVVYEIEHLPSQCPESEEAIRAENSLVDQKILELRQQCDVVSTTLKKRVLMHQEAFVGGIEQLRRVNDSLLETSSDCKKCRHALRRAKESTIQQLCIIAQKRGVDNCSATVTVLRAMKKMNWKIMQLNGLLKAGKMVEASQFLKREEKIEMEEVLNNIDCMREVMEEWRSYVTQPSQLHDYMETALKNCFTQVFMKDIYQNIVESTSILSSSAECCSTVEMLLWETAVQILTKSLVTISTVKNENASLEDIVAGIEPAHLVIGFVSMAVKLIDFFFVFKTVYHLHEEAASSETEKKDNERERLCKNVSFPKTFSSEEAVSSTPLSFNASQPISLPSLLDEDGMHHSTAKKEKPSRTPESNEDMVHVDLLLRMNRLGPRLTRDLLLKICVAIAGVSPSCFAAMELEQVVHLFVIVDLIIESMVVALRGDIMDVENARKELLDVLAGTLRQHFSFSRLDDLVQNMNRDPWEICDLSVSSLTVCKALYSTFYDDQVRLIHQYLKLPGEPSDFMETDTRSDHRDEIISERGENPFQLPSLRQPQDASMAVENVPFGHYWASTKVGVVSSDNHTSAQDSPSMLSSSSSMVPSIKRQTENEVRPPPIIIAASAVYFYQELLRSSQIDIVLRFPRLAERVMGWCEEWVSFYIFLVVDNFISISRSIRVEEQGDFSLKAQETLCRMRQSAENAVDAHNGSYRSSATSVALPANVSPSPFASASRLSAPTSTSSGKSSSLISQLLHTSGAAPSSPTILPSTTSGGSPSIVKFPPRVIDRIRSLFVSQSSLYALNHRVVACESARAVVALYECVLLSFQTLFSSDCFSTVVQQFLDRCQDLCETAAECLHVCLHRLSEALLPMEKICDEISHLKPRKDQVEVSTYVADSINSLEQLHQLCLPLPTPTSDTLLIQHSIFAVQCIMLRGYSKISKKVNDMLAMQLQVDSQNFSQQAAARFGTENVVRPRHVLTLVKTGFFFPDQSESATWLEKEHHAYNSTDIVNWFSCGDRNLKVELEVKLKRDLQHVDCLPLSNFLRLM